MTQVSAETRHATSVAIGGNALLITGASGSGKSDLALRLIDRGAVLVSDDYSVVQRRGAELWATPAPNIVGKMEIRGIGIVDEPHLPEARLRLIVALSDTFHRFPMEEQHEQILGIRLPIIPLAPFEASTPIKVERVLARLLPI
jgi:serine kinase of HPr protein (carbohydrate metabolism regulator)